MSDKTAQTTQATKNIPVASTGAQSEQDAAYCAAMAQVLSAIDEGLELAAKTDETALEYVERMSVRACELIEKMQGKADDMAAEIEDLAQGSEMRILGPVALPEKTKARTPIERVFAAMQKAGAVELAFSDGTGELKGVAPRKVQSKMFRMKAGRVIFEGGELIVKGPGGDAPVPHLAGVALCIDGEQLAWSPMARSMDLAADVQVNIAGNVVFG